MDSVGTHVERLHTYRARSHLIVNQNIFLARSLNKKNDTRGGDHFMNIKQSTIGEILDSEREMMLK